MEPLIVLLLVLLGISALINLAVIAVVIYVAYDVIIKGDGDDNSR